MLICIYGKDVAFGCTNAPTHVHVRAHRPTAPRHARAPACIFTVYDNNIHARTYITHNLHVLYKRIASIFISFLRIYCIYAVYIARRIHRVKPVNRLAGEIRRGTPDRDGRHENQVINQSNQRSSRSRKATRDEGKREATHPHPHPIHHHRNKHCSTAEERRRRDSGRH